MDALVLSFVAAALAEWGDKTQLLVIALAARFRSPVPVLAGVALAALANGLIAAWGGTLVHDMVTLRALSLLVAVALIYAGIVGFIRQKTPEVPQGWKIGAFATSLVCFFGLEFGDKTQFLTFAVAAQYDSLVLAAAGATAGVLVATLPAFALGERVVSAAPTRAIRMGIAVLFLVTAVFVAVNAWRLT